MLAYMDDGEPRYFSIKSILLLILMGWLVYLISPLNSMARKERAELLLVYPALIIVYWVTFQVRLLSLDPHVSYYLGPDGLYVWITNSCICLGFGAAFCVAILFGPGRARRVYGAVFLTLFLLLLTSHLVWRPPVMSL